MTRLHIFSALCIAIALASVAISPEVTQQAALLPYLQSSLS